MECTVEYTNEFAAWWDTLDEDDQDRIAQSVGLLEQYGPSLPFPYGSGVKGSRHGHMRESRIKAGGKQIRVLYAFNPLRNAVLLIGGDKTGDDRWYDTYIPEADKLYDAHLDELKKEGLLK